MTSAPNFSNPADVNRSPRAMAQPPGKDTFALRTAPARPSARQTRACLYQFIRRFKQFNVRGGNFVSAKLRRQHMRADVFQQTPLRDDVAYVREVVERDRFRRQDRRRMHGSAEFLAPLIATRP